MKIGKHWPHEFDDLAIYNAERARGIVHTREWEKKMETVQARFDKWRREGRV